MWWNKQLIIIKALDIIHILFFILMTKSNDYELCFSGPSDSFWRPERTMITIYKLGFSGPSDSFWRPEQMTITIYELCFSSPSDSFWWPKWWLRTLLFRSKWLTLMAKTNDDCELGFSGPSDSFWLPKWWWLRTLLFFSSWNLDLESLLIG